jgi:hypothetical protein
MGGREQIGRYGEATGREALDRVSMLLLETMVALFAPIHILLNGNHRRRVKSAALLFWEAARTYHQKSSL